MIKLKKLLKEYKYGGVINMKQQMEDGKFDPKNPDIHISGWGVLPLKSVHKWIAKDLKEMGIADEILPEPEGGTHLDYDQAASTFKEAVINSITELNTVNPEDRINNRIERYEKMGRWSDG